MISRSLARVASLTALLSCTSSAAAFTAFDQNPTGIAPLASFPNSTAAANAFDAALGPGARMLDFEGIVGSAVPSTLSFGGGIFANFANLATDGSVIGQGVNNSYFTFATGGTGFLDSLTDTGASYWRMDFAATPLRGFGFFATDMSDWAGAAGAGVVPPLNVRVYLANSTSVDVPFDLGRDPAAVNNASVAFFGYTSAVGITGFELQHPAHFGGPEDAVGIDNLRVAAVPEPGEWVLMAAGLALVAGVARRRRLAQR